MTELNDLQLHLLAKLGAAADAVRASWRTVELAAAATEGTDPGFGSRCRACGQVVALRPDKTLCAHPRPSTFQLCAGSGRGVTDSDWLERVREVVGRIDYRGDDYRFRVEVDAADPEGRVFIQLQHWRPDADTGVMAWGGGGKSYLSPHATVSEIVRRCLGLALAYEEHEVREWFRYLPEGWPADAEPVRVFGPHIDVDALAEVAHRLDVRP